MTDWPTMCEHHSAGEQPKLFAGPPHVIVARLLIRVYRFTFSAILGRKLPLSADVFGIYRDGDRPAWAVGRRLDGARRIVSCNPWGGSGFDPVPEELPAAYRWWRPWTARG